MDSLRRFEACVRMTANRSGGTTFFSGIVSASAPTMRHAHLRFERLIEHGSHHLIWHVLDGEKKLILIFAAFLTDQGDWNGFWRTVRDRNEEVALVPIPQSDLGEFQRWVPLAEDLLEECAASGSRREMPLPRLVPSLQRQA